MESIPIMKDDFKNSQKLFNSKFGKWVIKVKKTRYDSRVIEFSHLVYQTRIPEGMLIAVITLLNSYNHTTERQPAWMCELSCYFKLASKMKCCPDDDEFTVIFAGLQLECAPKLRKTSNGEVRYLRDHHCDI